MNIKSNQTPISYNKFNFKGNLASTPTKFKADKHLQEGLYDEAISEYQKALFFDMQNSEIKLNIGKSYALSNQFSQAIGYLENYIKECPNDIENKTLLGECYKKTGQLSKAKNIFKEVLNVDSKFDYAKRNLLDTENLILQCSNPEKAKQERYQAAINNLNQALKIARNFLPENYLSDMKDITLSFDKTAQLGGRSNIAQYEHSKRKISISEEYTYANPQLVGAYLIHELVHGKDNDAYTSIKEEQDAYRAQAQYWVKNVENVSDPEMDYVANLYKQSAKTLDDRVAEIYKLRDPNIAEISYNHPPQRTKSLFAFFDKKQTNTELKITPIKAYDIIV